MTEIKLSEAEVKMIELKREEERIEKEKQEIESQIKYQKDVEYYKKHFLNNIETIKRKFENIENLYNKFIEDGLGDYIKLTTSIDCRNFDLPSYTNFKLKEEDKIEDIQVTSARIDFINNMGSIYDVTDDLKFELPSSISSRYQKYSYKTALVKIKEAIENYKQRQIAKIKEETVKEDLKSYFLKLDPKCVIEEGETWERGGGRNHGFAMKYIEVTFENTNYIRVKYYSDGTWVIIKQIDNRLPKDKFEIVQNLAK